MEMSALNTRRSASFIPRCTQPKEPSYKKNKKAINELAPMIAAITRMIRAKDFRAVKDMLLL